MWRGLFSYSSFESAKHRVGSRVEGLFVKRLETGAIVATLKGFMLFGYTLVSLPLAAQVVPVGWQDKISVSDVSGENLGEVSTELRITVSHAWGNADKRIIKGGQKQFTQSILGDTKALKISNIQSGSAGYPSANNRAEEGNEKVGHAVLVALVRFIGVAVGIPLGILCGWYLRRKLWSVWKYHQKTGEWRWN